MENLRFVALTHDLGKVFDRKNHQKVIIKFLLSIGIKDKEMIDYLQHFHERGNGKGYLYLVKYSDQYASMLQRVNTEDYVIPQGEYYRYLKKEFKKQLAKHFLRTYTNFCKLRKFIQNNQILAEIPSDVRDASKTSLRQHLLLTDQVLCLLLRAIELYPCSDFLFDWVRSKKVDNYLSKNIQEIPKLAIKNYLREKRKRLGFNSIPNRPKFSKAVIKLHSHGWNIDKIALHFGLMEDEVTNILDS